MHVFICVNRRNQRAFLVALGQRTTTPQMTSSARQDFLSFAFHFNNQCKEEGLIASLTEKYQACRQQHILASENLECLEKQLNKSQEKVYQIKQQYQLQQPPSGIVEPQGI